MPISDVLVLLDADDTAAGRYALELAAALKAKLTAIAPVVVPHLPNFVSAEFPGDLLDKIREEGEDSARKLLASFAETAQERQIPVERQLRKTLAGEVGREIARYARYFDLTILNQGDPERNRSTEIIESVLFSAGRPILVVPYIFREPARFETVLVGWDGGHTAARALADSLPILEFAQRVQIVTVADPSEDEVGRRHSELIRHLSHHQIEAEAKPLFAAGDVANTLLSHAADISADLLVMGGYGHSRLREVVLGGATREILRSMTLPVLMSH